MCLQPSSLSPAGRRPRSLSTDTGASPRLARSSSAGAGAMRRPVALTVCAAPPPLSLPALKKLLVAAGEFPAQHRAAIWAFLLRLPANEAAFESLRARGAHECVLQLEEKCAPPARYSSRVHSCSGIESCKRGPCGRSSFRPC